MRSRSLNVRSNGPVGFLREFRLIEESPLDRAGLYIDIASYTLTLVMIGHVLAILTASSMLSALITT